MSNNNKDSFQFFRNHFLGVHLSSSLKYLNQLSLRIFTEKEKITISSIVISFKNSGLFSTNSLAKLLSESLLLDSLLSESSISQSHSKL